MRTLSRAGRIAAVLVLLAFTVPAPANAWRRAGHVMISQIAAETLPESVPGFLRTPDAIWEIGQLGPEADQLRESKAYDADVGVPAHFVDLDADGKINGVVAMDNLPPDRESYDTALRASGTDQYAMGYLPYEIVDGFLVVEEDFAWWRAFDYVARTTADPTVKATMQRFRALRETLTIRDIGYWSHFVGDGSQPLHASLYYDGWEPRYPNSKGIHAKFEGEYVSKYVTHDLVKARVKPFTVATGRPILAETGAYLAATNRYAVPLYEMFEAGSFATRTGPGVAFTADRIAFGATELRDLIVKAWVESENANVSFPHIKVKDILNGTAPLRLPSD